MDFETLYKKAAENQLYADLHLPDNWKAIQPYLPLLRTGPLLHWASKWVAKWLDLGDPAYAAAPVLPELLRRLLLACRSEQEREPLLRFWAWANPGRDKDQRDSDWAEVIAVARAWQDVKAQEDAFVEALRECLARLKREERMSWAADVVRELIDRCSPAPDSRSIRVFMPLSWPEAKALPSEDLDDSSRLLRSRLVVDFVPSGGTDPKKSEGCVWVSGEKWTPRLQAAPWRDRLSEATVVTVIRWMRNEDVPHWGLVGLDKDAGLGERATFGPSLEVLRESGIRLAFLFRSRGVNPPHSRSVKIYSSDRTGDELTEAIRAAFETNPGRDFLAIAEEKSRGLDHMAAEANCSRIIDLLAGQQEQHLADALLKRAELLAQQWRFAEALADCEAAICLLGDLLKQAEEEKNSAASVELMEALAAAKLTRGRTLRSQQWNIRESLSCSNAAVELLEGLVESEQNSAASERLRGRLASALTERALCRDAYFVPGAMADHDQAVRLRVELGQMTTERKCEWAEALVSRSRSLQSRFRFDEAIGDANRAIELLDTMRERTLGMSAAQWMRVQGTLAAAYFERGTGLQQPGKREESKESLDAAASVRGRMLESRRGNEQFCPDLIVHYAEALRQKALGVRAFGRNKWDWLPAALEEAFQHVEDLWQLLNKGDDSRDTWALSLFRARYLIELGTAHAKGGDHQKAEARSRSAIRLLKDAVKKVGGEEAAVRSNPALLHWLGYATGRRSYDLSRQVGKLHEQCLAAAQEGILWLEKVSRAINPDDTSADVPLYLMALLAAWYSNALLKQTNLDDLDGARQSAEQAVRLSEMVVDFGGYHHFDSLLEAMSARAEIVRDDNTEGYHENLRDAVRRLYRIHKKHGESLLVPGVREEFARLKWRIEDVTATTLFPDTDLQLQWNCLKDFLAEEATTSSPA